MMGSIQVNQLELARIFAVSVRTVQRWGDDGLPRHGAGQGTTYDVADAVAWVRRRDREQWERDLALGPIPDLEAARARKEDALARLRELDVGEREGELVTVEDALEHQRIVCGALRSTLLNVPGKYAPSFVGIGRIAEAQAQLDVLIRETLTRMIEAADAADDEAYPDEAA